MLFDPSDNDNNRKTKVELVLQVQEGKLPTSVSGLVDPRLFKGGNKLYMVQDPSSMLWGFKYDIGGIPSGLNQRFTNREKALEFAKTYLKTRNLEVKEVID